MAGLGTDKSVSLSNCFVIGEVGDSYGSILAKDEEMVQLMKRRGGVGLDLSKLRPSSTKVHNAANSSTGAISFMERYSNSTREVSAAGRRGALMLSMDVNHPDILEFVKIKRDLTKVTGANISIKLNKEFMQAVENDEDYILRFPCDSEVHALYEYEHDEYNILVDEGEMNELPGHYIRKIKAREYWDEIIKSAHGVAEPGLMYWDNMVEYSPDGVYPQYKPVTTNPCSEIGMQSYDACRLIAINLFGFVEDPYTGGATFNFQKFYNYTYEAMRLSDDLIDLEIGHIDRIIDKIKSDPEDNETKFRELSLWEKIKETASNSRRTGLGFTALGDVLASLGLGYGSEESLEIVEEIMELKMRAELDCTIDLAILRGTFEGFDIAREISGSVGKNDFYQMMVEEFPYQSERMAKYGRRNVSWSTVAPTGSVSLLAQVSSGIEPLFMPFYKRRKKINPHDTDTRVDFVDVTGDSWQEFFVLHKGFKDWVDVHTDHNLSVEELGEEELQYWFTQSPWFGSTANDIHWESRVKMQALIQKYTTHSISSTVNLPRDVSEEEVSNIYMEAWKQGIKGITVYRDGSRDGVLVSSDDVGKHSFTSIDAVSRPKTLKCDIHTTTSKGVKYNVIIGLLDDLPYEVFVIDHFTNFESGELTKVSKGRYDLVRGGEIMVKGLAANMTDEQEAITRLLSTSLRHQVDVQFLVEQLNKTEGNLFGFTGSIARVLKKYIPDGAKSNMTCNECGLSGTMVFQEGCQSCTNCGSSKCG